MTQKKPKIAVCMELNWPFNPHHKIYSASYAELTIVGYRSLSQKGLSSNNFISTFLAHCLDGMKL